MEDNEFVRTPEFRRAVELINYRCPKSVGLEKVSQADCENGFHCDDCWNRAMFILYDEEWED